VEAAYAFLLDATRDYLDTLSMAAPSAERSVALAAELEAMTRRLSADVVEEPDRMFGQLSDLRSCGQVLTPTYAVEDWSTTEGHGIVTFGTFFYGGGQAAHGGAVPLLLDELFGRLVNGAGIPPKRTAYLHVDYRSVVRLGRSLRFRVWLARVEGRKHFLQAAIRDGDVLVAEGSALFVALRPGQP
jgi:acyl-coenzyme A thioesterase PaaI-like protein